MNVPNKLTLFRVCLVPLFLVFFLVESIPYHYIVSLFIFSIASFTDLLDGHLARKNNQVTTFGKFLDPLADKILVISAIVCFVKFDLCSVAVAVIIIAREFMITSLRLVALSSEGKVIAAGFLGKLKTIIQMVVIIALLLALSIQELALLPSFIDLNMMSNILMWAVAVITIVSGVEYLIKNRSSIDTTK